jgi:glutamate racemase
LATPATFQGALYASVVERFAKDVQLMTDTCDGLVDEIEVGNLNGAKARKILEKALSPMLTKGIDTVVLGCTHYPFVIPVIESIVGPNVRVIDPAPAVARQVERVLTLKGLKTRDRSNGQVYYLTTGSLRVLARFVKNVFGEQVEVGRLSWKNGVLHGPE